MMNRNQQKELDFVLRHYREDVFSPEKALKRLAAPVRRKPLHRWVAVAASLLCLVVFAGVFVWQTSFRQPDAPSVTPAATVAPAAEKVTFHFDDTPLPKVLDELGQYYGVRLTASDTARHLTGDFGGQQLDEILGMMEEVLDVKISQNGK